MTTAAGTYTQAAAGNLRAEMARQRKTGKELGALLGVSQAAASRRTTGETSLTVDELCLVAEWLDIPVTALVPARPPFRGTTDQYLARYRLAA